MADLRNAQREIEALNRRAAADVVTRLKPPAPAEVNLGLGLSAGARVLDLVTGEEGVILGGQVEHIIVSAP